MPQKAGVAARVVLAAIVAMGSGAAPALVRAAPAIGVAPASLSVTLPTGGTGSRILTVSNRGGSPLHFQVTAAETGGAALGAGASDPRTGRPVVDGLGGPDAYGYHWKDSDESGGPGFRWIDISETGTIVLGSGDDVSAGPFPIGFTFSSYGSSFTTFRVCSNGFLDFTTSATTYANTELPNAGAPRGLLAPLWDDLNLIGNGRVYYQNVDGNLIVEWYQVPPYSGSGAHTFEAVIAPSGEILFQYLTLGSPTNSCTVGIQDTTATIGLQCVFNADYLHDNMAIRFRATPDWLGISPNVGTVGPGQSVDLAVAFAAGALCGDAYHADIHVLSDDPVIPDVTVPATMNLLPRPLARVSPTSLNFGQVYLTLARTLPLTLSNVGCAPLEVAGLAIDNSVFTIDTATPFTLPVGGDAVMNLTYAPVSAGPAAGSLTITSNDSTQASIVVGLAGVGLNTPTIGVSPSEILRTVAFGDSGTAPLTIRNEGEGTMHWTIPSPDIRSKQAAAKREEAGGFVELPKGEKDPREGGPVVDGFGGPDSAGYHWIDSDEPGGPAFAWIEISGSGTVAISSGDDINAGPFPIGFTFKFYGQEFTTFRVCSNGWISFSSAATAYTNSALPNAGAPLNLLSALWDDLNITGPARVYFGNVNGNLVVEWSQVPPYTGSGAHTFEIVVMSGGRILFQYLTLGNPVGSCTVGIQNGAGTVGLQCAFNTAYLHETMAIEFATVSQWLTVAPAAGNIPPHSSAEVTVKLRAAGLELGNHLGTIRVRSNDLLTPEVAVPVAMEVADPAGAEAAISPAGRFSAQSAPNPARGEVSIAFSLPGRSKTELRIFDLRGALVRTLVVGDLPAGAHRVLWDGRTNRGDLAASGSYFYRLTAGAFSRTRKLTLLN